MQLLCTVNKVHVCFYHSTEQGLPKQGLYSRLFVLNLANCLNISRTRNVPYNFINISECNAYIRYYENNTGKFPTRPTNSSASPSLDNDNDTLGNALVHTKLYVVMYSTRWRFKATF